jgi:hypothetical protein
VSSADAATGPDAPPRRDGLRSATVGLLLADAAVLPWMYITGAPHAIPGTMYGLVATAYLVVGLLIVERRPANRVGPLAFAVGAVSALSVPLDAYVTLEPPLPARELVAWAFALGDGPLFAVVAMLVLLFPTGRLPSPRWRPVAWLAIILGLATALITGVRPGPLPYHASIDNPFGIVASPTDALFGPLQLLFAAPVLLAMISPAVRWGGAGPVERAQLKWIGVSGVAILASVAFYAVAFGPTSYSPIGDTAVGLALSTFPVAIGAAILRYRLFDIDRLISRTLAWAIVSACVVALYLATILLLQGLLGRITQGDTLSVAGSTLLAAAAFQPIRRRVQVLVDRRFDRSRLDAERAAAGFAARLRDEVDLDHVVSDVRGTTTDALLPRSLGVWLRPRNDLRTSGR